jgi:hypothetical protein
VTAGTEEQSHTHLVSLDPEINHYFDMGALAWAELIQMLALRNFIVIGFSAVYTSLLFLELLHQNISSAASIFRGYSLLDAGDGVFSVNDGDLLVLDTGSRSVLCSRWYIRGSMVLEGTYALTEVSLLTSFMVLLTLTLSSAVS